MKTYLLNISECFWKSSTEEGRLISLMTGISDSEVLLGMRIHLSTRLRTHYNQLSRAPVSVLSLLGLILTLQTNPLLPVNSFRRYYVTAQLTSILPESFVYFYYKGVCIFILCLLLLLCLQKSMSGITGKDGLSSEML